MSTASFTPPSAAVRPPVSRLPARPLALVVMLVSLVYWAGFPCVAQTVARGTPKPVETVTNDSLPAQTAAMRQTLIDVARSGRIDDLLTALEVQERGPSLSGEAGQLSLKDWKAASADGQGHAVLANMANLLMLEPAVVHAGADSENGQLFVWPYLAERPLDKLTDAETVDLLRLMPEADAQAMKAEKRWTWWRLGIGADGIWHVFKKGN